MQEGERIHVGGYEAWMENGILTMHYHKAGKSGGVSMKLSPEETLGLLELLSENQDSVHRAATDAERQHTSHHLHTVSRMHSSYTF